MIDRQSLNSITKALRRRRNTRCRDETETVALDRVVIFTPIITLNGAQSGQSLYH